MLKSLMERLFDNKKTTVAGIIALIVALTDLFGVNIDKGTITTIVGGIAALIGLFAKD